MRERRKEARRIEDESMKGRALKRVKREEDNENRRGKRTREG
jgi:hypothetical protein